MRVLKGHDDHVVSWAHVYCTWFTLACIVHNIIWCDLYYRVIQTHVLYMYTVYSVWWIKVFLQKDMVWKFPLISELVLAFILVSLQVTCLQFCDDRIVSGSDDTTLKIWSAITGQVYDRIHVQCTYTCMQYIYWTCCTWAHTCTCNYTVHVKEGHTLLMWIIIISLQLYMYMYRHCILHNVREIHVPSTCACVVY